jgi:hypothetical protein
MYTLSLILNGVLFSAVLLCLWLLKRKTGENNAGQVSVLVGLLFKKGFISYEEYVSLLSRDVSLQDRGGAEPHLQGDNTESLIKHSHNISETLDVFGPSHHSSDFAQVDLHSEDDKEADHNKILSVLFTDDKKHSYGILRRMKIFLKRHTPWFLAFFLIFLTVFVVTFFASSLSSFFATSSNSHILLLSVFVLAAGIFFSLRKNDLHFVWWGGVVAWCLAGFWYTFFFSAQNIIIPTFFLVSTFFLYFLLFVWIGKTTISLENNFGYYFSSLLILFLLCGIHLVFVPYYVTYFYLGGGCVTLSLLLAFLLSQKRRKDFLPSIFFLLFLSGVGLLLFTAFSSFSLVVVLASVALVLALINILFYNKIFVITSALLFIFVHTLLLLFGFSDQKVSSFLITQKVFAFFYISFATFFAAGAFYKSSNRLKDIFLRKISAIGVFLAHISGLLGSLFFIKQLLILNGVRGESPLIFSSFSFICLYGIAFLWISYKRNSTFLSILALTLFFVSGIIFISLLFIPFSPFLIGFLWGVSFVFFEYKKKFFRSLTL